MPIPIIASLKEFNWQTQVTCFIPNGDDHDDYGDDDVKEVYKVPQQSVFKVGNNGSGCHKSQSITEILWEAG